jgi:hypothetical protein
MARFEKLSETAIEELRKRRAPTLNLQEYMTYLSTLSPGDWGAVTLDEGESQRAVKRRLTIASRQKGLEIRYKRGEEGKIVFEVK